MDLLSSIHNKLIPNIYSGPTHTFVIGELAPLLSVLGHEKHKRHKTAGLGSRLIWMCVAMRYHVVSLIGFCSLLIPLTLQAFIVIMYSLPCIYKELN